MDASLLFATRFVCLAVAEKGTRVFNIYVELHRLFILVNL